MVREPQPATWQQRLRTRAVILAAMRPDPSAFRSLLDKYAWQLDWNWALERARVHKVDGMIAHRVRNADSAMMPEHVAESFRAIQRNSFLRAHWSRETLRFVGGALDQAAIPFVLLKGPFLSEHVYPNPTMRIPRDLDLWVVPSRIYDADRVLRSIGYEVGKRGGAAARLISAANGGQPEPFGRGAPAGKEVQYTKRGEPHLTVDLHWHLADPVAVRIASARIEQHSTLETVAGADIRVLDREAMLIHLAVHAMTGSPSHLWFIHFADLAAYIYRFQSECDPERVRSITKEWRAEAYLCRAFQVIQGTLGVPIPCHLDVAELPGATRRACFRQVSATMFEETYPRRSNRPSSLREAIRWVLWFYSLRIPLGHVARLAWEVLWPLLPRAGLSRVRRWPVFQRIGVLVHLED